MNNNIPQDASILDVPNVSDPWYERLQRIISVSEILRIFGACAVLASMSLFLLNGWSEVNDISRYLKLLAQTGLLTAAGAALSVGLREYKGARIFFGLGLVSVVANFTILGALVYSMVQWDSALTEYPIALTWQAVEWSTFLPVFVGASLLLVLLSRFGFGIFARQHSNLLTAAFLFLCLALMLPLRNSLGISILVVSSVFLAYKVVIKVCAEKEFVATPEAKFSLLILFLPAAIMLVRAISLYQLDEMLALTLSALGYFALRAYGLREPVAQALRPSALHRIGDLLQLGLAINMAVQISSLFAVVSSATALAMFCLSLLGFAIEFAMSDRRSRARTEFTNWIVLLLSLVATSAALLSGHLDIKVVAWLSTVLVILFHAFVAKKLLGWMTISLAICASLLTSLCLVIDFVDYLNLHNWILIGAAGGVLILAASFYERLGPKLLVNREPV